VAPDKQRAIDAFRAVQQAALDDLERGQDAAREGTRVDGSHRPVNRGERGAVTSLGYLAAGLAARIAELVGHLTTLSQMDTEPRDQVGPGAIIALAEDDGPPGWYALLPGGLGTRLVVDDVEIMVLSPASPLAVSLAGARAGDSREVQRRGRTVVVEVVEVG
jgi:transcription elongation GreA/GreB family factor